MVTFDQLVPGIRLRGLVSDGPVTVIGVQPFGQTAVKLTYEVETTGQPQTKLLFRSSQADLELVEGVNGWTFDADGAQFRLAMEAQRLALAHLFDPQLAVSVSHVEALPHQIAAVYDVMLHRQPLRFLLADDPGAGKTVMTGLLIKELLLRGDVRRCLIVVPAALDVQWQEELRDKFDLRFDLLGRPQIEAAIGNPFAEYDLAIGRIDLMKQDENVERLRQVEWDLVVVDEAHKMSAEFRPGTNDIKETARYKLGRALGDQARHFLLLTATPHRGKQADFQLLLALLDRDRFAGRFRGGVQPVEVSDLMRRMLKEDLLDFEGRKLFPERFADTVAYALSEEEAALYEAVTRYVREEMNRADRIAAEEGGEGKRRRVVVGFALTVLQRRLASSPEAIFRSLTRRRERLERTLAEEQTKRGEISSASRRLDLVPGGRTGRGVDLDELETDLEERPEGEADEIVDLASAARTLTELEHEIRELRRLEDQARWLRDAGVDAKWREMARLLDSPEMFEASGRRAKLVVFTEHRDTLGYLVERIGALLGRPDAVVAIHGGMDREARRQAQDAFVNDDPTRPETLVLVATDAAGEGINLQRAHLMVNYDLPWNPTRLEQRFGRIHRFGQQRACHNWNLIAAETREGDVYRTLFEKLEEARKALGGKVFDVLGQLFEDKPLRDLMLAAIQLGNDPARREELERQIGDVASLERYRELVEQHALATEVMDAGRLSELSAERERAEINRLVPHFIASFFVDAFHTLGGTIQEKEGGTYSIAHVPAELRRLARQNSRGTPILQERYGRITFDKERVGRSGRDPITFVAPGHPLLDLSIRLVQDRFGDVLRSGAVLIDPRPGDETPRVLFAVKGDITDERTASSHSGTSHIVSSELHFVEVDRDGRVRGGSAAPYLDYRPLEPEERDVVAPLLAEAWLRAIDGGVAQAYAIEYLVPHHFDRVKREREAMVYRVRDAVDERLTKEIIEADRLARDLRQQQQAGTQLKMNADRAERAYEELRDRRRERLAELDRELHLSPQPPLIAGAALVLPETLIASLRGFPEETERSRETRRIEAIAMREVLRREADAGRRAVDVSAQNLGYDIESIDPMTNALLLIEVKGRDSRGDTVTLTRNEQLVARNKRSAYNLVVVQIDGDQVVGYHTIPDPLGRQPDDGIPFGMVSSIFAIDELLDAAD